MDKQAYETMKNVEMVHWWFVGRREIISNILKKFIKHNSETMLDIGCGTGGNLIFLKDFGNVTSVEMSEEAIENFRKINPDDVVYQGYLPHNLPEEVQTKKFSFITMFDVLEHIEEEDESLKIISQMLDEDGVLLCTVPAYQWLWSKSDEEVWHKRRYTKKQLCELLQRNGFKIEYSTYFNTFLFPIAAVVRILSKFNNKYNPESELAITPANGILKMIFRSERLFIPSSSLCYGLSICTVATLKK